MRSELIAELLPDVMRRTITEGSVLSDFLAVMEAMHAPIESTLVDFGACLDPYRCPPRFVPYLAHWVGLGWLIADTPPRDGAGTSELGAAVAEGPLRNVVAEAAELAKLRGTRHGLERMLELATGVAVYEVTDHPTRPFAIEVQAPESARAASSLVGRIVAHEKPAFVTASVVFDTPSPNGGEPDADPGPGSHPGPGPGPDSFDSSATETTEEKSDE